MAKQQKTGQGEGVRPKPIPVKAGTAGGNGAWAKKRARHTRTFSKKGDGVVPAFDQTPEGRKKRQATFIEALSEHGTVRAACRAADIERVTYYKWIKEFPEFKEACEASIENFVDDLEEQGFLRAKDKSDLLLMFHLKRFRPQYRDNYREPQGKAEEEEARQVAREDVQKKLDILAERRMERLVTEGSKGKLKLEKAEESEDEVEDEDPDVEVVVKRSRRA